MLLVCWALAYEVSYGSSDGIVFGIRFWKLGLGLVMEISYVG